MHPTSGSSVIQMLHCYGMFFITTRKSMLTSFSAKLLPFIGIFSSILSVVHVYLRCCTEFHLCISFGFSWLQHFLSSICVLELHLICSLLIGCEFYFLLLVLLCFRDPESQNSRLYWIQVSCLPQNISQVMLCLSCLTVGMDMRRQEGEVGS